MECHLPWRSARSGRHAGELEHTTGGPDMHSRHLCRRPAHWPGHLCMILLTTLSCKSCTCAVTRVFSRDLHVESFTGPVTARRISLDHQSERWIAHRRRRTEPTTPPLYYLTARGGSLLLRPVRGYLDSRMIFLFRSACKSLTN